MESPEEVGLPGSPGDTGGMDSPEEVSSPLLHAGTPDIDPEDARPATPELGLEEEGTRFTPPGERSPGYEPPSPIKLPKFEEDKEAEDEKPGTSSNYPNPDKTPAKEPDFYDLPDNLSDNEEQNQGQAQRSGLINDIFGDSDDEEEQAREAREAAEAAQEQTPQPQEEKTRDVDEVDTDEELEMLNRNDRDNVFVSDFDMMIEKKKAERKRSMSRRKKDVTDIINSSDDRIMFMISQMREAAEEDKRLNAAGQAAVNKLALLSDVIRQLKKHDLQNSFIDCGILPVLAEWLSPLPDNSLPHITIRTEILAMLTTYPQINTDMLKDSKVGRVVMGLYKNSKERFSNREVARKLIHSWARPIFGLTSDYKSLTREDRMDADLRHMVKSRKRRRKTEDEVKPEGDKPGEKNFVMRARVPMPSNTDYVIRPRSKIEDSEVVKRPHKAAPQVEKLHQKMANRKKLSNPQNLRTSTVCLTGGSKMPL